MPARTHPSLRIGIIGGGQLGRMMLGPIRSLGLESVVLDAGPEAPAASGCDRFIRGDRMKEADLRRLASEVDITTFEIEHVNTDALIALESEGHLIRPRPAALALINDKLTQKQTLAAAGVPCPAFTAWDGSSDSLPAGIRLPAVQKARRGGYDGRGVAVISDEASFEQRLPVPSILEDFLHIDKELALIVARRPNGESVTYPAFEMHFDPELNICTSVSAPAAVGQAVERAARKMAETCAEALDVCGILAVELILTTEGELLLNEVAPRPHNSGHLTIEAAATSQFEQHVRAVADFPLGTPRLRSPSIMINVLGSGSPGPAAWTGLEDALSVPDAHPHVYGKRESRPGRKMGHVTLVGPELGELRGVAEHLGATVGVSGEEEKK